MDPMVKQETNKLNVRRSVLVMYFCYVTHYIKYVPIVILQLIFKYIGLFSLLQTQVYVFLYCVI